MFNDFRYRSLVKTRRLLLPMGVAFALILFVQYFELPYGNILPSLFSAGKFQAEPIDKFPGWDLSGYPNGSRNFTHSSSLNATNVNVADEVSSIVEVSDEKDSGITNVKDAFDSESIKNIGAISDDDIDPEDEFPPHDLLDMNDTSTDHRVVKDNSSVLENIGDIESPLSNYTSERDSSLDHIVAIPQVALSPSNLQSYFTSPENLDTSPSNYVTPATITSSMGKDAEDILLNNEDPKIHSNLGNYSAITSIPVMKKSVKEPAPAVLSISKMNELLLQSHVSYRAMKPRWSSTVDQELRNVKSLIENTAVKEKDPQFDVSLYRNFSAFKRSYELMEQILKVYIYAEGERPIFHQPPLKGIYASEGWFMKQLKSNKKIVTKNPKKAHLFYLPFSSRELEIALYIPNSHSRKNMYQCLSNYVDTIATKYHFWNRTSGADHFLVACHDWGPAETSHVMANCIRALCNSDVKEGFQFGKDVSLPETYVRSAQNPLRQLGGKPPSERRILAFFAGNMHGYLRPILLKHWENKDPDMKIYGLLRKVKGQMSYVQYMKSSKYCICAKGYEVNSPRVVEAIFYECVPVIISDNFVPPLFETLNWESFAVFVPEKDIPNLKNILLSIPKQRYIEMQQRVKKVQQHFLWHSRPVKYDLFHMILHSIWYSRVFQT